MFLLFLIGVAVVTVASAQRANVCSGLGHGTLVRNTQDCSSYYFCFNGLPMLSDCPSGQTFNHISRRCDHPERVDCFQCPAEPAFTDVAVPNECNQFIRCQNQRSEQLTCADGLRFDPHYETCNIESAVECPFTVLCPRYDDEIIFVSDRDSCNKYHICINGEVNTRDCPPTLHFNLATTQCDLPINAGCTANETVDPETPELSYKGTQPKMISFYLKKTK